MKSDRLQVAIVGRGSDLTDLLVRLDSRARPLRLNIAQIVDLDGSAGCVEICGQLSLPSPENYLNSLPVGPPYQMVVARHLTGGELRRLREIIGPQIPILGPEQEEFVDGLLSLVDRNHALSLDSRRLKETRRQLNLFVLTAPLGVYIKDQDHRYVLMNNHALHVLGFREDDVVRKVDEDIYPPGQVQWLRDLEAEAMKTEQILCATGVLPAPGQEMRAQVTIFPITENRRTTGVYGLIEDTTELYENEQKLHDIDEQLDETQKYLREVLEHSKDMIFLTDPDGRLLSFNNGAQVSLGYPAEDVIGQPASMLCEDPEDFQTLFQVALREGHANRYEAPFRTREGNIVISNISLTMIKDADDQPLEMVCLCRDITQRLQLKNDLIRSERLAAIGNMAAGVAHEINNPLAVIDTIAGLVEETLDDEGHLLPDETRQILAKGMERLHHQVERCTKITHSLLGFVRKDQAGMAPINLQELLGESLDLLDLAIHKSRAKITIQFDEDVPIIRSDPSLLQQVFLNLLKNALDATEEIVNRESCIIIETQRDQDRVIISIEDNGVGIAAEDQSRIFDLFHTTKPAGKGTGLGLSIVHDILVRLGGNIRVTSVPGKWSRFLVELPVVPPENFQPDPMSLEL